MGNEWEKLYTPWEELTVFERFERSARTFENETYIYSDAGCYTYRETYEYVTQMADYLSASGVKKGDHVGVFMRNSPSFVFLIFALAMIGAVEVPMNIHIKKKEFLFILNKMDISYLVSNTTLPDVEMKDLSGIRKIFTAGLKDIQYSEKISGKAAAFREDPSALLAIFMTSGSSGFPKGVMLRHDMIMRSAYGTCLTREFEQGRRIMLPTPLFHMMAYMDGVMAAMIAGCAIIISAERFSPAEMLETMKKYEANDVMLISSMMTKTLKENVISKEDYPALHHAFLAGNCPEWVWEKTAECFGVSSFTSAYGLTECGSTSFMSRPEDDLYTSSHTNGVLKKAGAAALPGLGDAQLEARICDEETGEVLPFGKEGILWLRGATMTRGYYNDEKATAAALAPDGWFRTGDICTLSEEGSLVFLGRSDDMYKINGENVSAVFVDGVMGECSYLNAVETVGIPDSDHGAVAVMFIDPIDSTEETKERINDYICEHLARYQRPKHIVYSSIELWPKTDTEKIQKKALRKIAADLDEQMRKGEGMDISLLFKEYLRSQEGGKA